jgi:hypothetical protein
LKLPASLAPLGLLPVECLLELAHERSDQLRREQAVFQTGEHRALEHVQAHRQLVGARAAVLVVGAAIVCLADQNDRAAAGAAADQARQQVLRPARVPDLLAAGIGPGCPRGVRRARLDRLPECVVDDAQGRHVPNNPVLL